MTSKTLVAGAVCLELANTVNNWHQPRHDVLSDGAEAAGWATEVLGHTLARLDPAARQDLRRARSHIRAVFREVAAGSPPEPSALAALLADYRRAVGVATLSPIEGRYNFTWQDLADHVAAPFAADAFRLLHDGPLHRVGECPSCGWLFLDTSKNNRRTWCSMSTCGARSKAQRHYRRTRAER